MALPYMNDHDQYVELESSTALNIGRKKYIKTEHMQVCPLPQILLFWHYDRTSTVCPFRYLALVNFIHGCPIFGWAAGPLTRGAGMVASKRPIVIDIVLSFLFENNSQPPRNKQHIY